MQYASGIYSYLCVKWASCILCQIDCRCSIVLLQNDWLLAIIRPRSVLHCNFVFHWTWICAPVMLINRCTFGCYIEIRAINLMTSMVINFTDRFLILFCLKTDVSFSLKINPFCQYAEFLLNRFSVHNVRQSIALPWIWARSLSLYICESFWLWYNILLQQQQLVLPFSDTVLVVDTFIIRYHISTHIKPIYIDSIHDDR